jgi:hypothetical protein
MALDFAGGALKGDPINQKELVTLIEQALGGMSAFHIFHCLVNLYFSLLQGDANFPEKSGISHDYFDQEKGKKKYFEKQNNCDVPMSSLKSQFLFFIFFPKKF